MKRILYSLACILLSISAFSQGYSGLIARWPFTGNANDVSGNGLNGIVRGATLTTGYAGLPNTAYKFNGTGDYITVPYNSIMNSESHSICVLMKPLGFYSGLCQGNYVLARGAEFAPGFYGLEYFDNAYDNSCSVFSPLNEVFAGGTGTTLVSDPGVDWLYTPYIDTVSWYCVVLTYDGSITNVYIDGLLKTTFHNTCTYTASTDSINIGKSEDGPTFEYWINGVVDEIRLYNRVLSPTEVAMFCDSAEANFISSSCDSISLPDTIKVCKNGTTKLPAVLIGTDTPSGISWSPPAGLSDPGILDPTLAAGSASGWYYLTVASPISGNLVVNGNFSAGDTGFTSAYPYVVSGVGALIPAGLYTITTDPTIDNPLAPFSFGDHTTGSGNMMAINGASSPIDVWCETITVTPNTYYDFSAWFANWSSDTSNNLPIIQFEINGALIGALLNFPHPDGLWTQYSTTWYSGINTSISICINDQQTAASGNDFAFDDISFRQLCIAKDSVYVDVIRNDTIYNHKDISACANDGPITLTAPAGYTSYLWSSGGTGASVAVSSPGTYWVDAYNGNCNLFVDTFHATFIPVPVVALGNDTSICINTAITLSSPQPVNAQYSWSNGSNASTINVSNSGDYSLTVTINGCSTKDSILVTQIGPPKIDLGADTAICTGNTLPLLVNDDDATYLWSDGSGGQNFLVSETGIYWATVSNKCGTASDTINVTYEFCDIWFPSAFTPNDDGRNDIIRAVGSLALYKDYSLSIYNRFGQRIFYTQDIYAGWDGVFNGTKQDLGTFFYMMYYSLNGKKSMMKGDFELIR